MRPFMQLVCTDIAPGGPAGPALHSCWRTMLEYLQPLENTKGSFKLMDLLAGQILFLVLVLVFFWIVGVICCWFVSFLVWVLISVSSG